MGADEIKNETIIKKLEDINKDGISPDDINELKIAVETFKKNVEDSDEDNDNLVLIEELNNGLDKDEGNLIIKGMITFLTNQADNSISETISTKYNKFLAVIINQINIGEKNNTKKITIPQNFLTLLKKKTINTTTEQITAATDILNKSRDLKLAKALIETNETDFNNIFNAFENSTGLIDNPKFKGFCAAYSDYSADEIGKITVIKAGADDEQFIQGINVINITPTDTSKKTERFTYGTQDDLVNNYTNFIKAPGKLTPTNLNKKFKIIEEDCNEATNKADYFKALAEQIGKTPTLQTKFLKLFMATNGTVNKNMLKYLGSNKDEQIKNLNEISKDMTPEQKKQIQKITLQIQTPKFAENLSSTDLLGGGLEAMKQKLGPIKGVLMKILNMINSNPMLRSMFGGFFDKDNGVEDRLTEGYELTATQKTKVADVIKAFGSNKKMKSVEDVMKNKTKFETALTSTIDFDDISPDFKDYMMNATGKDTTKKYENIEDIIKDYMEMIGDKSSPLRTKYEDAMKQLKDDGVKDPDLIQIMTASILNFQQDGEGMKYLWTRNNVESTTADESTEDVETPEEKGKKKYEALLTKITGVDQLAADKKPGALLSIYDEILNGKDTDLMTHIGTLDETALKTLFAKFPDYLTTINDNGLKGAYEGLPEITKPITSVNFENNKFKINNEEINIKEKPFPEDVKTAIDKLNTNGDITTDHTNMLKALNTNFDEVITHYKKEILTGNFNTQDFLTTLANTGNQDFTTKLKIKQDSVKKDKSKVSIVNNSIKIELNKEDGTTEATIIIEKGANGAEIPTFA